MSPANDSIRHQAMVNTFLQPNSRSVGVIKLIDKLYPALAEKVFEGNTLMENLVMSGFSTMDILNYPICGHCETIAAYDGFAKINKRYVSVCTCFKCGMSTVDPTLFREWCLTELKKKAPPDIADILDVVVDVVAEKMKAQAEYNLKRTLNTTKAD